MLDANSVAPAAQRLRAIGHNVEYIGERHKDPGDAALLAEAAQAARILVTKDPDVGAETALIVAALQRLGAALEAGQFVRLRPSGARRPAER